MAELYNTSHEYRCIFIHVPKTAGTSIKQLFGFRVGGHWPWTYYAQNHPDVWRDYTSFAVVRNPWDRMVSAYQAFERKAEKYRALRAGTENWQAPPPPDYEVLANRSLAECLQMLEHQRDRLDAMAWHSQAAWVAGPQAAGGHVMVDRVLRYENLEHDFNELAGELGLSTASLPRLNRSGRTPDYRGYYNAATRQQVERLYAVDIETFGYRF